MYQTTIEGIELSFAADTRLFSPNAPDRGTLAMLSRANFQPGEKVLDLGCGYGLVGIYAAKICGEENVLMSDVMRIAAGCARQNAEANGVPGVRIVVSDGFRDIDETGFDIILSNPPYHADFSVAKHFIEKGYNRLKIGGRFLMVTKRLLWYKNKITAIFGGVHVTEIDGYFVFEAERRTMEYARKRK